MSMTTLTTNTIMIIRNLGFFFGFLLLGLSPLKADHKTFDFVVDYKTVNFDGEEREAVSINGQLPGPTLRAKEGDLVTINVHNKLKEGASIHWHGLLVPWQMDGVVGVNQDAIPPGGTFTYTFTLKQAGTYWYHSHRGLQEQEGLYGGIIIDPIEPDPYTYTKDFVVVLSDWKGTPADQIFANLKKTGEFYVVDMPLQPSLRRFAQDYQKAPIAKKDDIVDAYLGMQDMRMGVYDISDVAYDSFLLNGHTKKDPWIAKVNQGDTVRLRFVGAGASSIFRVKIPGTKMRVVQIQGKNVEPYEVDDFTVAPGETLDALVRIEKEAPYFIYAESIDTAGSSLGALVTNTACPLQIPPIEPFPEPAPMRMKMAHDMGSHMEMAQDMHHHGKEASLTQGTKYQNLKAAYKTNDPSKPVEEIQMVLSGYMDRFIWFINGVPEYLAEPIRIEPGKRYRLIFTNMTMMHHPMHLHGHFMILRNGHGAYDPYVHTIDVPPNSKVVADFDADVSGQWYFHCHNLYHMAAGMARVFRYSTFLEDYKKEAPPCAKVPDYVKRPLGHGDYFGQSSYIDLGYDPYHNVQKGNLDILIGNDHHKLQLYSEDAEIRKGKVESADLDIFYWHPISQFWALKGGANYFYKPSKNPYWQPGVGVEGLFPGFIATNLRTYLHKGSVKFDLQLSRDTQLFRNIFLRAGLRGVAATSAVKKDLIGSGLNYIEYIVRPYIALTPRLALFVEYDFTQDYGNLKSIARKAGQATSENVLMVGFSFLY